jgi:hypothetical protein
MFYFKILIFLVISLFDRHCDVLSNRPHPTLSKGEGFKMLFKVSPFAGDLEGAYCFVHRNDACVYFIVKLTQPANTNQISLSTLLFFNSLLITFKAFFFLASFAFLILAASAFSSAASVLLRS